MIKIKSLQLFDCVKAIAPRIRFRNFDLVDKRYSVFSPYVKVLMTCFGSNWWIGVIFIAILLFGIFRIIASDCKDEL